MKPIIVIADDITGAAEMAGLALSEGCRVRFTTQIDQLSHQVGEAEVVVVATDTRSMLPCEASRTTMHLVDELRQMGEVTLFKKCDSALRGYIVPELCELMRVGYERALILAANPSKGRRIEQGIYTIDGTPIAETVFATDPEFPARTSEVTALSRSGICTVEAEYHTLEEGVSGVTIGQSRSVEEIGAWIEQLEEDTLLVGAADAFRALLHKMGHPATDTASTFAGLEGRQTLIVCGSTVRHDLSGEPLFQRNRVAECPMPDCVFEGASARGWIAEAQALMASEQYLLLRIPQPIPATADRAERRAKAVYLRNTMATTVASLVKAHRPDELIIEGGASAFAILEELGWSSFTVENEVAPGVVRLGHTESGCYVTFKPGSYPWGALFA